MQDVELNSIKSQLENLNALIYSNNADLLSCAEKLYILTSKNKFLNDEIEKRNMYFQELYTDDDFNSQILPPLIKHTLERTCEEEVLAFMPVGFYEKADELNKDNWKGFYSNLFFELSKIDIVELKIRGIIECEEEQAYKKFCKLVYEIPNELYVREIHYYLTIIRLNEEIKKDVFYRKENEKFLTELLNLKEATLNLTTLITFLVSLVDSKIKNNLKRTINDKKNDNISNKKNILVYNKNEYFTLDGKKFLQLSESLTQTLKAILDYDTSKIKISTLRSNVHRIKNEAKKILQNEEFEILNFNRKAKEYQLHKSVIYKNNFNK